ncbi:MAG: D-glycero-beta-D-manno-heptose 1-phosphate adenylyltransferase [Bacteriovoracaceae bacterium]|jgi:rfaE bifunctional protein nucleotidyltransferase chain/domain|nr:D-glycero-beta-D-manno-heptose 1-phosphate adenylyltransferase [Halobacteriovoraceae bacterium]MDP7321259.1 D-glycero-beta-D-manno-heptose 1-phosphate adenylyltransferase [Bacteriovoracaceae bacterium]|tara:strand:- start:20 stop:472 length:453 start_codon:yes stop_codon:yes gene_type:complete
MNDYQQFLSERKNKKVVFTNGCFDILHRGHISYLNEAKSLGDILVLGLNSDESVKRLKGPTRPVNNEQDRKFVLENLKSIDYVFIFTEDTPYNLISKIKPDILVKGGDWKIDQIVGSDIVLSYGGEVKSLNFIDGFSTTKTINKINSTSK